MKKILFIAFAMIVATLVSCNKIPNLSDGITFGNTTGMTVTPYDSTGLSPYLLDLNDDGTVDVELSSQLVGSAGLGHHVITTLQCRHQGVALAGELINQEQFMHVDTSSWYYFDPDYPQFDSILVVSVTKTRTCNPIDEGDQVVSTSEKLLLNAYDAGNSLRMTDDFGFSDKVFLKNASVFVGYGPFGYGTPVLNVQYEAVYNDCDVFPLEEVKYIGFKIHDGERERLGWIKLTLELVAENTHHVKLLETAVQR